MTSSKIRSIWRPCSAIFRLSIPRHSYQIPLRTQAFSLYRYVTGKFSCWYELVENLLDSLSDWWKFFGAISIERKTEIRSFLCRVDCSTGRLQNEWRLRPSDAYPSINRPTLLLPSHSFFLQVPFVHPPFLLLGLSSYIFLECRRRGSAGRLRRRLGSGGAATTHVTALGPGGCHPRGRPGHSRTPARTLQSLKSNWEVCVCVCLEFAIPLPSRATTGRRG